MKVRAYHGGNAPAGVVVDVEQRSSDAEFILEGDEFLLDWRELRVAPEWFRGPNGEPASEILASISGDRDRFDKIRKWVEGEFDGDTDAAIKAKPLLALEDGYLLDGWHRLAVWLQDEANRRRKGPVTLVGYSQ